MAAIARDGHFEVQVFCVFGEDLFEAVRESIEVLVFEEFLFKKDGFDFCFS